MKSVMAKGKSDPAPADGPPLDIEQECATWDWARTAGVSAQELRKALLDSFGGSQARGDRTAEAA